MEVIKSLKELESELKSEKKRYDKLQKRLKKCYPDSYEYENLYDEVETLYEDILQLQLLIQEERRKKKREQEMNELLGQ
jgi:predicted  nucleic acid-binding Zn-ribbon protein